MTVSVIVPYRSGCEWRARAWDYVRRRYQQHHPEWDLIEGSCEGEWSKGAAVADALGHTDSSVLVLADADSYTDPATMRQAVDRVHETGWVVPHFKVFRLGIHGTNRVYRGDPVHFGHTIRAAYVGLPGGGITVITRDAYEAVGGIDPRFLGWGGEDISFGWALDALIGPPLRLEGDLWHLWHPHPAPRLRGSPESEALVARYTAARGEPLQMQALIEEVRHGIRQH